MGLLLKRNPLLPSNAVCPFLKLLSDFCVLGASMASEIEINTIFAPLEALSGGENRR